MYFFQLSGTLVLLVLNSPYILLCVPFLAVLYVRVAAYYRNSSRELQRLDSISKSPVYAAFGEALTGAPTIQAPTPARERPQPFPPTLQHPATPCTDGGR